MAPVVLISTPVELELLAPVEAPHSTVEATQISAQALEAQVVPIPVEAVVAPEATPWEPQVDRALSSLDTWAHSAEQVVMLHHLVVIPYTHLPVQPHTLLDKYSSGEYLCLI